MGCRNSLERYRGDLGEDEAATAIWRLEKITIRVSKRKQECDDLLQNNETDLIPLERKRSELTANIKILNKLCDTIRYRGGAGEDKATEINDKIEFASDLELDASESLQRLKDYIDEQKESRTTAAAAAIPAQQPTKTTAASSIPAQPPTATTTVASVPAQPPTTTTTVASIPAQQPTTTTAASSIPAQPPTTTTTVASIPAQQPTTTTAVASVPAQQSTTTTAVASIPAQQPTTTTAASSIPAQQPTTTTAVASVPAQQSTTTTAVASIPAQQPTTTTAVASIPAQQPTTTTAASSIPAQPPTATTTVASVPAQPPTTTTTVASIPAQQPTTTTAVASIPAQQPTTTTAASSIPAQPPTATTTVASVPAQPPTTTTAVASIPAQQPTTTTAVASIPAQQPTTTTAASSIPAQPPTATTTVASVPAQPPTTTTTVASIPAQQPTTTTAVASIPAQPPTATTAVASVPAQQPTTTTAVASIPAQQPTTTTAVASLPAQQPTTTTAVASIPAQPPTTTTAVASIPAQQPTTTTAVAYTPTNAGDLRSRLFALITIFEKVLMKLLESQGQIQLQNENASTLAHSLLFHVFSKNKKAEKQFIKNSTHNTLHKAIDHCKFDVTLLIALIKNVNSRNCFIDFRKACNNATCTDCSVKYSVEDVRKLRNATAHETNYRLDEFLNKTYKFPEFKGLGTYEKLMQHFEKQFNILHKYLKDCNKFPLSSVFGGPIVDDILVEQFEFVRDSPQKDIVNFKFFDNVLHALEHAQEANKNTEELKVLIQELIEMKNDENRLCNDLPSGKVDPTPIGMEDPLNPLTLKDWHKKCRDLYEEVYKNGVNFFDFVHPGSLDTPDTLDTPDNLTERFLNDWFNQKVRNCFPLKYALIGRYNAKENKSFENSKKAKRNPSFDNHYLILNLEDGCIYYIRQTEVTSEENIDKEIDNLKQEFDCFQERYTEELSSGANIDICRILIQTNKTKETIKVLYQNLEKLSGEKTESLDSFDARLRKFEEDYSDERDFGDSFAKILSRVLGFSSILFKKIPHINDNFLTKISKMPLTKEQQNIVDSNDALHVILRGSYGTGKTLVLQRKIYKLAAESSQAISIYVILADSTSMLYGRTKELLDNYKEKLTKEGKEVKIESCRELLHPEENIDSRSYDVTLCLLTFIEYSTNDVNTLLEGIIKDKKNIHIFIDEFNANKLTEDAARKLSHLLTNELKSSTLYIVPQPLKIHRSTEDQKFEAKSEGYRFKETGMEILTLEKAIRNPKSVHELFRVAKEVIMEFKLEYQLTNFKKTEEEKIDKKEENKAHMITGENNNETENADMEGKAHVITAETKKEKEKANADDKDASSNEDNIKNNLPFESICQGTSHLCNDSNSKKIISSYQLEATSKCEHALIGDKPKCYLPFKIDDKAPDKILKQPVLHLTMALKHANAHKRGSVVICSSIHQSEMCYQALEETCKEIKIHLPSLVKCTRNDAVDCYQKLKDGVIITDSLGVRGMELKNVIVVLSTIDYYLVPFSLEAFTRASGRLSIVLLNRGYKTINTPIAIKLVDRCYEKKLIKKVVYSCQKSKLSYDSCTDDIKECNGSPKDHEKYFRTKGENSQSFDQSDIQKYMELEGLDENDSIQRNDQMDFDEIDEKTEEENYGKTEDKEKKPLGKEEKFTQDFENSDATYNMAIKTSENWCRLAVCTNVHVKRALVAILHNEIGDPTINGLPSDPAQLFTFMVNNQNKLKRWILKPDMIDQLFPHGKMVYTEKMDVTLLRYLILTFCNIVNQDGNCKEPRVTDHSIAAAVYRAASLRNSISHYKDIVSLDEMEFNDTWNKIECVLKDLRYTEDISFLKTQTFDPDGVRAAKKQFHDEIAEG